ncbi:hypothetical protein [Ekhidna sp.]|uniref:hypothetical protein n=1 Tax=Ekhidna sp. TaxID=2608089 RepID=UPI003B50149F
MRLVCYVLLILVISESRAQEKKNEKETPIKLKNVPEYILKCLEPYTSNKTQYYRERDGEKKSYEIKFKYLNRKYSVEFDDSLKLEDVEIEISEEKIDENAMKRIKKHLSTFEKFKFQKIQLQISSNDAPDQEVIKKAITNQIGDIINYEIEIGIKEKGEWSFFEMTFSQSGEFLFQREIIERSSNNILY